MHDTTRAPIPMLAFPAAARLLLPSRIAALVLAVLVPAADAGADAALRRCRANCVRPKTICVAQAKHHLKRLLRECATGTVPRRRCRREARAVALAERRDCGSLLQECRACCAAGDTDCAANATTTTTVGTQPTTTTLPDCRLPATGQTRCWDRDGTPIDCAGTGQDGDVRAGAPLAHTDQGDGTIRDDVTGLVWEKLGDDGGVHDKDGTHTWTEAFARVATLNAAAFAGRSDWRVPNVKELLSIADYDVADPALSPAFDHDCVPGCTPLACSCPPALQTWTSTSSVVQPTVAWLVSFRTGSAGVAPKSSPLAVRAVRGDASCVPATGQTGCWDGEGTAIPCAGTGQDGDLRAGRPLRFTDNGDGTVTDENTKLVWEKQSRDRGIHESGNGFPWGAAVAEHVQPLNDMAFAGHTDWRMPNLREQQSIVDYQQFEPAAPAAFDDGCQQGCTVLTCSCSVTAGYWSSTSDVSAPGSGWYQLYRRGDVATLNKLGTNGVRAVRGGHVPGR